MRFISLCLSAFLVSNELAFSQSSVPEYGGFIRTGIYPGMNELNNKPDIVAAFADLGIYTSFENGENFRSVADIRFRYGSEFGRQVSNLKLREGYIDFYGSKWEISAGQKIVNWGRADFTNLSSKLTPRDLLLRTPDREEMNLGNILAQFNFYPSERLKLQFVAIPMYRSSTLITDPIPIPSWVTIELIDSFVTRNSFSYGMRADIFLQGIDFGFSWFEGPDPMPGVALTSLDITNTGGFPVPSVVLNATPYRITVLSADFETHTGAFGFRGETAWSRPDLSYVFHEFVPLPQVEMVAGSDWTGGKWHISAEYYGKYMYNYSTPDGESFIGTEPDLSQLAQLFSIPGFDPDDYIRNQVSVFNRLYNYQLEQLNHSAAVRVEYDLAYDKISASLFSAYNITAREILLIPEIKYRPSDGLIIVAGAEFYHGKAGSLYRMIDSFMNSIYTALRVDF